MSKYNDYQEKMKSEIISCIETMECLPILFIGSGLSKRYFNAPNWDELLEILCSKSTVFKEFAFYKQNYKENAMIGSILAKEYNSWAWDAGRTTYDEELFKSHLNSDIFIKKTVATHIESITPNSISEVADIHKAEVTALKKISPHAIITTNYDKFLENIFTDYEVIIGQKILRTQYQSIGEIFKIHGSVEEYADIVDRKSTRLNSSH